MNSYFVPLKMEGSSSTKVTNQNVVISLWLYFPIVLFDTSISTCSDSPSFGHYVPDIMHLSLHICSPPFSLLFALGSLPSAIWLCSPNRYLCWDHRGSEEIEVRMLCNIYSPDSLLVTDWLCPVLKINDPLSIPLSSQCSPSELGLPPSPLIP